MVKIKDLIDFQKVKDVIDIDSDLKTNASKKNLVSEFIISDRMKAYLMSIAENLSLPEHKSIQIIGGYGSGKSHLLAWLVSLLENPELIKEIRDEDVKKQFEQSITREYAVVQFELQPFDIPLSEFFFDRLKDQLEEKKGIKIPQMDFDKKHDYKSEIQKAVDAIKKKNPKMGLVVVIDEISDFLKQKIQTKKEADNQFLRILGQVSKSTDFTFIGSMQEDVFTSDKYIDSAESFGRVSERFEQVTISSEDVKNVLAKRILKKSRRQYELIDDLLAEYKKTFPLINSNPDEFIEIFPIHPYVVKLFAEMEYFEKRGVIQFTMDRVSKILDNDFPSFITYDYVFDEINSKHTIRNLDKVRPLIEVFDTLHTKIDLIDARMRDDARRIIKALIVLRLYGKTTNNGATPEELVNQLLLKSSTAVKNTDRVVLILDKIREVTSGQFIKKDENSYFYIDIEGGIDYDEVIKRKTKNLSEGMLDEAILDLLHYTNLIDASLAESYTRVFLDSCNWPDKKSFRLGHFIYDDGTEHAKIGDRDFNLVIKSPYNSSQTISSSKNTAIIHIQYNEGMDDVLKQLAATRVLIGENYSKTIMQKKKTKLESDGKTMLLERLIDSDVEIDGNKLHVKSILSRQPESIDEFFANIKVELFNQHFSTEYPKYPKFFSMIAHDNILSLVDSALNELIQKGEKNLFSTSKNILSALDLIDVDGNIDSTTSYCARVIIDELKANKGKNVKIEDVLKKLSDKPIGLDKEMTLLIVSILTYSGEILLKKKGGGTISSSDLPDVLRKGIGEYKDIPYATLETEFPVESVVKLFRALGLNHGLIRNSKDLPKAVQEFRVKALEMKENMGTIERRINEIATSPNPIVDRTPLVAKLEGIRKIPIDDFLKVKTVNDFKKVEYLDKELKEISDGLTLMSQFTGFLKDYDESIQPEYMYMERAIKLMEDSPEHFPATDCSFLIQIRNDCRPLILETNNILDQEKRRMLRGKLGDFKRKYSTFYYQKHTQIIGEGVDWERLLKITKSPELAKTRDLKAIKVVNSLGLTKIEERISAVLNARCPNLREEHLKDSPLCMWCNFPSTLKGITDINGEITKIDQDILRTLEEWTKQILDEMENYKDNIGLLDKKDQKLVKQIQEHQRLPTEVTTELIMALNSMFSELTEIRLAPQEIIEYLFSDTSVLDYDEFSKRLDEYKERILSHGDKKNIRIMRKGD